MQRKELKSTGYEIFIGALSLLSIVNLGLIIVTDSKDLSTILKVMNAIFSVIFLADFSYRLATAPSRRGYFFRHFGWADLLASVPLASFKFLRIFRLVRVARLLRTVGIREIGRTLIRDRAGSALYLLLLAGILVLEFGSLEMLYVEKDAPGANITTASDSLWYTIVTISTVGYGDQYPVTNLGRFVGVGIIVVGVGIFGTFTGYLANLFLSPKKSDDAPTVPVAEAVVDEPTISLSAVRELIALPGIGLTDVDRLLTLSQSRSADRPD